MNSLAPHFLLDLLPEAFLAPPFLPPEALFLWVLALPDEALADACCGEADEAFLMFFDALFLPPAAAFLDPPAFFVDLFATCPFAINTTWLEIHVKEY